MSRKIILLMMACILAIVLGSGLMVHAAGVYYVAKTGNDTNPGTEAAPWLTIQKAANTLLPGDTVNIKAGTYNEKVTVNVSGTAGGGFITFQRYGTDRVIMDGTGKTGDDMILVQNKSYIKIIGLEICNNISISTKPWPKGIFVVGAGSNIEIRNNKVYSIKCPGKRCGAHGIAVYGKSAPASYNNIIVDGNEVYGCKLGWSESVVLNGNVENFQVTNNYIHNNDNIGIDFIGYEGECPDPAYDRARNGVCRSNVVTFIDALGNPAYGTDQCADGIYVDGGTNIIIERNLSHDNNIGIELASEWSGKTTSYITVRDNIVYNSTIMGIAIGGYDTRRGSTVGCVITNNTLYNNDVKGTSAGEFVLQFDLQNNTIKNNIAYAGAQNLFMSNPYTQNVGSIVNYNIYYSANAATARWQWKNVMYTGFSAYKAGSGNDANSLFADPLFVNLAGLDFHLQLTSPAINAGDPAFVPGSGETDFAGNARVLGGRVDCGAYEKL